MFIFKKESDLVRYIIKNRRKYFDFEIIQWEKHIKGGRIDLFGEDSTTEYLVEIKKDLITNDTLHQINRYLSLYSNTNKKKTVGIVAAPEIALNLDQPRPNVRVIKLDGVVYAPYIKHPIEIMNTQPNDIIEYVDGK